MITDQQIDETVLEQSAPKFLKVAIVIARTSKVLGENSDEFYERIAGRMTSLTKRRKLEVDGDLSHWRNSEVRLPPP
jgi:hypothetical protein